MKQLTVFVENRRGGLARLTGLLAKAGVDMKALSIADTREFGILRLIVSDTATARAALEKEGFLVQITEVTGVRLADRPGELSRALAVLDAGGVNLEYLYAFLSSKPGEAAVVLRVENSGEAERLLKEAHFSIL